MQRLILIASFLGKCDFINYPKCTMFANTVPWEQGRVYDKCGGRPIADAMMQCAAAGVLTGRGMHKNAMAGWLCETGPFR